MPCHALPSQLVKQDFALNACVSCVQLYNGPRFLVGAYSSTLDGLMQVAVDDAAAVNSIQLIITGVEGVAVSLMAFLAVAYAMNRVCACVPPCSTVLCFTGLR